MSDRELLELAAKAVGYEGGYLFRAGGSKGSGFPYDIVGFQRVGGAMWNPLTNDGDALRLAIALKLDLEFHLPEGGVTSMNYDACAKFNMQGAGEKLGEDEGAATRRAITRAAAQIGKAMP